MSIYEIPEHEAERRLRENPAARWHLPGADVKDPEGPLAIQRLKRTYFTPHIPFRFRLRKDDRVFAMGSCFARTIEQILVRRGLAVESVTDVFDRWETVDPRLRPAQFVNKETPAAMLNELVWALVPGESFPEEALVRHEGEEWIDPHSSRLLKFTGREETLTRRKLLIESFGRIRGCRVVVLTLGLVEVWFDRTTGHYLNMSPTSAVLAAHPGRYVFRVLEYPEVRSLLDGMRSLLKERVRPDIQIIVTVSPVPLIATFSGRDVVVANAYSKAVLRAATEAWAAVHDDVQYFPSYEIVTNSDPARTWQEDGRHIQFPVFQHVQEVFERHFLAE